MLNLDNIKEINNMIILTKPINYMIIVNKNKIEDIKKNRINPEFLKRCLDYSKLMKGKIKR